MGPSSHAAVSVIDSSCGSLLERQLKSVDPCRWHSPLAPSHTSGHPLDQEEVESGEVEVEEAEAD